MLSRFCPENALLPQIHEEKLTFNTLLVIFAIALIFILVLLPALPVINVMEARNFQAAQEIVENGQWLLPTLNGAPRILKPPLPTWCSALMSTLVGDTRQLFWLRLPNGLMGLLLLLFVWLWMRDVYGQRAAVFSVLILATTAQFIGEVPIARWDLFACAFGTGGLWATARALAQNRHTPGYFILAILLWAAAYLSKGPVALLLIFVPFFLAQIFLRLGGGLAGHENTLPPAGYDPAARLSRMWPATFRSWCLVVGIILLSLVLGHSWWWAVQWHYPQTWQAITGDLLSKLTQNYEPWYFYVALAPGLLAPWSLLLIVALLLGYRIWRSPATAAQEKTAGLERMEPHARAFSFMAVWALAGLFLLSLASDKKGRYFLMVLPIFAMLLGTVADLLVRMPIFQSQQTQPGIPRICSIIRYLCQLQRWILAIACWLIPVAMYVLSRYGAPLWILLLAPLWVLLGFRIIRDHLNITRVVLHTSLVTVVTTSLIFLCLPTTSIRQDKYGLAYPVKALTQGMPLYLYGDSNDNLLWAMGRCYERIDDSAGLLTKSYPAMLLADSPHRDEVEKCLQQAGYTSALLYQFSVRRNRELWYLYRVQGK